MGPTKKERGTTTANVCLCGTSTGLKPSPPPISPVAEAQLLGIPGDRFPRANCSPKAPPAHHCPPGQLSAQLLGSLWQVNNQSNSTNAWSAHQVEPETIKCGQNLPDGAPPASVGLGGGPKSISTGEECAAQQLSGFCISVPALDKLHVI